MTQLGEIKRRKRREGELLPNVPRPFVFTSPTRCETDASCRLAQDRKCFCLVDERWRGLPKKTGPEARSAVTLASLG